MSERALKPTLPEKVAEEILELMKQEKGNQVLDIGARYGLRTFEQIERAVIEVTGRTWRTRQLEMDVAQDIMRLIRGGKEEQALTIAQAYGLHTLEEAKRACVELGIPEIKELDRRAAERLVQLIKEGRRTEALIMGREYGLDTIERIQEACAKLRVY